MLGFSDAEVLQRWVKFLEIRFREFRANDWRRTQADWAVQLGVNNGTLSTWMLGRRKPTEKNIHYLAHPDRLGPEIYDIFPDVQPPMPNDPELRRWIALYNQLPDDVYQKAVEIVDGLAKEAGQAGVLTEPDQP